MCECCDDCECYDEGYDDGWSAGQAAPIEKLIMCPVCGELLQGELFTDINVVTCVSCRREFKLVEKE